MAARINEPNIVIVFCKFVRIGGTEKGMVPHMLLSTSCGPGCFVTKEDINFMNQRPNLKLFDISTRSTVRCPCIDISLVGYTCGGHSIITSHDMNRA